MTKFEMEEYTSYSSILSDKLSNKLDKRVSDLPQNINTLNEISSHNKNDTHNNKVSKLLSNSNNTFTKVI